MLWLSVGSVASLVCPRGVCLRGYSLSAFGKAGPWLLASLGPFFVRFWQGRYFLFAFGW
jgi:hypothetical protein